MSKNEQDIYRSISKILNTSEKKLKNSKKLSDIEDWDSLNQLNILMKLDKMFNNKITNIPEMKNADSMVKIIKILRKHALID